MYVHCYILVQFFLAFLLLNMGILELLACCWCCCNLVNLASMSTVNWLHHPLLYMGLFIDAFTLFPRSLFGLAVPDLGARLEVPSSHMRIYSVTSVITSTTRQQWETLELNHNSHTHKGQSDLLAPNISVGNNKNKWQISSSCPSVSILWCLKWNILFCVPKNVSANIEGVHMVRLQFPPTDFYLA